MGDEWEKTTLAELSSEVSYGYTESATNEKVGPRFLRITDIQHGIVDWRSVPYCPINEADHHKYKLHDGDIVIARTGNSTGENFLYRGDEDAVFASYLIRFRINPSRADARFVWYNLRTTTWWNYINNSKTGSAQAGANASILGRFPIILPPLREQQAIACILAALDDKIELNRRMNRTLEEMAWAIFKSWFVDFDPVYAKAAVRREYPNWSNEQVSSVACPNLKPEIAELFPDAFEDSKLGMIPKGWRVKTVSDVAERVGMGPFGSSIKVETFVSDGVPIISGQHLRKFILEDNTFNFITNEHANRLKSAIVQRGDIIFTHAGNIGQVSYIPENSRYGRYIISQRQFFMRCDLSQVNPVFIALYFNLPIGKHQLLANTSSSGVPSIARPVTHLRSIQLPIPQKPILDAFETTVRPLLFRFRQSMDESITVAALRDELLPKLISGQIRVSGAERILGRAF